MGSPGFIRERVTARLTFPIAKSTMEGRPGSSVIVSSDSSLTVTRALSPMSTRTIERSCVLIRSR